MKNVTIMQVRDSEFSSVRPEEVELVPRLLDRQWLEKGPYISVLLDIAFLSPELWFKVKA
jgi:hypothetical protein